MKQKKGISLIVLIVTIIVIIILAAVVVLTLSKNNPVESARKARFMEDVRSFQDELALSISNDYVTETKKRKNKFNATEFDDMKKYIPSFTKDYDGKLYVKDDELMYKEDNVTENEKKWLEELGIKGALPKDWEEFIASVTDDGVPIPKGFTYVEGTKETGTVIQDDKGNEFVWIPVDDVSDYKKDFDFPKDSSITESNLLDDVLPNGITNETLDVAKYGGFYIGRYEAGTPDGTENTGGDRVATPVSKKDAVVWTNITYGNAKKNAEQMISNKYVQTGLLTGKAWDTTCHWIEDYVETIVTESSLRDSRFYGNYLDSESPANVVGYGKIQKSGYSDAWKTKNIYDLAGNVREWSNEIYSSGLILRGGSYANVAKCDPVSYRDNCSYSLHSNGLLGFRPRLYIKTN